MKLSEAIRVGAKIRPQAFGVLYNTEVVTEKVGWFRKHFRREKQSCAMGAAIEAQGCTFREARQGEEGSGNPFRGEEVPEGTIVQVLDSPPEWAILNYYHDCPQCEFEPKSTLLQVITHLNDIHKWTREQIALLVERFEKSLPAPGSRDELLESLSPNQRDQFLEHERLEHLTQQRQAECEAMRQRELTQRAELQRLAREQWPETIDA